MAKVKNNSFAQLFEELKRNKVIAAKPVDTIEERKYFLIVTEGERTEPNYFNYFANSMPKGFIETIDVQGQGDNTIRIVKKAIALREERSKSLKPNYDEVWAVYDKDNFPDKNFNDAVVLAEQHDIGSAHSNESFELWYVLHFEFLQTELGREDYIKILSKKLGFKYEKNNVDIVKKLFVKEKMIQAIKWAKQLDKNAESKTSAQAIPTTKVWLLVRKLLIYKGWINEEEI